jgi:hypothetical protein
MSKESYQPPKLPIYSMPPEDFEEFRKRCLNTHRLERRTIEELKNLFGLDHFRDSHPYSCFVFSSPESAVVYRLIEEIERQRKVIGIIHEQSTQE